MTDSTRFGVIGIGNAILDVLARVEEGFLPENDVQKGVMQLVDTERAQSLYGAMPTATEISGGSAANTIVGLAQLGVQTGFVAKVRDDQLGGIFAHDIRAAGVRYDGPIAPKDSALETARCMIMVTPDGERSMSTYLGISTQLKPEEIDEKLLERTDWLYLEGYLFDSPEAKEAYFKAIAAVRRGGGRIALTCSDPFCIERHRDDFRRLIADEVDLLFANRDEALSLFQTDNLDLALGMLGREVELAAVTLSAEGAVIRRGEQETRVAPQSVEVTDTTGAGDLFAAGFLAGLVRGYDDERAGHMGNIAAGRIISQMGARSTEDLNALMAENAL